MNRLVLIGTSLARLMVGLVMLASCLAPVQSQAAGVAHVTRAVQVFTDLESALMLAVRQHDQAGIDTLVGDEFEMIVARDPGAPVPREDWLAAMAKPGATSYGVTDMSVRELGPVAITTFKLRPSPPRPGVAAVFVVDIWERSDTQWQLTSRHVAPASGNAPRLPGETREKIVPKQK